MDKALIRERLLAKRKVDETTGCWLWTGAIIHTGYGHLWEPDSKAVHRVHRLAYRVWHGPIPDDQYVLHRCDVRACFNPDHLFLGTRSENMRDASAKGRLGTGTRHLTDVKVLAIFSDARPLREIAATYGVDTAHVAHIKGGQRWSRLTSSGIVGRGRLTPEDVRAIRRDTRSQKVISEQYGIAQSTVSRIRSGKRHVSVAHVTESG
jgi:hypothetical protein